ncbi:hypothetical protein DRP07_11370 [Archaeoglobales archaeon]|nr:MAG: hypothetical protein DRP07_11370 [Archaeoglobales archaeon]
MKHVYAQTVIREDKLEELKRRTGMNTKDALLKAVEHYLSCHLDMSHIGIKRIEHSLNVIKELKEELTG